MRPWLYFSSFAVCLVSCSGQILVSNSKNTPAPNSWDSVNSSCQAALNTTVNCPDFLTGTFMQNPRLTPEKLTALCTSQCLADLNKAKDAIGKACSLPQDVIEMDRVRFPASWLVDRYLYSYQVSCRKDAASGQYCDTLRLSWLQQGLWTDAQVCSDCVLGGMQTDLNSPFGYDKEYEDQFRSSTSSCKKSTYSITTPGSYTIDPSTSTTITTLPTPSCHSTYVATAQDTCSSIALKNSISTWSLIKLNGLDPKCQNLQPGANLCIADSCLTLQVKSSDTCNSIIASTKGRVTVSQFYTWNPNIDALCMNLHSASSSIVCIGPPGSDANSPGGTGTITPVPTTPVPTTAAPVPTNHALNSNTNCAQWYTTKQGDTCFQISSQFKISLADFYFLNPMIDSTCSNLWISTAYCVTPVGSITTYPGYPTTSLPYTLTSETFTAETWKTVPLNPPAMPVATDYPLAAGTWSNCTSYQNVNPRPPFVDQSDASVNRDFYWASLYQCNTTASIHGITMEQLFAWNPSLSSSGSIANCILQPNLRYCTLAGDPTPLQPVESLCDPITAQDVKPGTNANCDCWKTVIGVDQGLYTCASLVEEHKISLKDFLAWNPWIGTDCDKGLYAGLSINDASSYTAACVRLGTGKGTSSISKSSSNSKPTSSSSSPTSSLSASPV